MDLLSLSRTILLVNQRPISKVRFARVIYFVHKELIRKKLLSPEAIAYIRSPLGPVPDGYLTLARDAAKNIISQHNASSNLSYTAEEYAYRASDDDESAMLEQYRDLLKVIQRTLRDINRFSTPELVELSHNDPGWQEHRNGEAYFITPADLRVSLPVVGIPVAGPIRIKIRFSKSPTKSGAMQANLLRGMISDIVKESTDLEYPDEQLEAKRKGKDKK